MKKLALVLILALIAGGSVTGAQTPYVPFNNNRINNRMTIRGHDGPPAPDGSAILYDVSLELAGGYVLKADEMLKGTNGDELVLRGNVRLTLAR
jgi:hypothetical protein